MYSHPNIKSDLKPERNDHDSENVQHPVQRLQVRHDMVKILSEDTIKLRRADAKVDVLEIVRVRVPLTIIRH